MNSSWGNVAEVIMAAGMLVGAVGFLVRWFYKRGGEEKGIVKALNENTVAMTVLTVEFRDFRAETLKTLQDHGWRLKILEDKTKEQS